MSDMIYSIRPCEGADPSLNFFEMFRASDLSTHFRCSLVMSPVLAFRDEITSYIIEHGFSSLYDGSSAMEAITSPSITINEIERVVGQFVSALDGARRILIIDPYFYAGAAEANVADTFRNLLAYASSALKQIIVVTNGKDKGKADIHAAVRTLIPGCNIVDHVRSEFHDRFWLDPDSGKGLVMGTSLNGLGKKVALVDRLQGDDVAEIIRLTRAAGVLL